MTARALIIDDEVDLCRLMQITLKKMGIATDVSYNLADARERLANQAYDFCLTDLRLPDGSGLDLVKELNEQGSSMPIAIITAHGNMDLAIQALKYGAFDFVNKPLELPRLRQLVEHTLKIASENNKEHTNEPQIKTPAEQMLDERLIGISPAMNTLKKTIVKLARSQAPVFLWGESGTGKEVVAKLIHDLSSRREGSFVPVNCGAIPSELMESEFFGHKKGSFTGATADKKGLFQQADGGTLFLDEVADLPLAMQVKLLRAIQEKTIRPIGDTKEYPVDIRILSATHKDLAKLVQSGDFRQDLFYRINVITLKLPTLNEREQDISQLAAYFLKDIALEWGLLDPISLNERALERLRAHDYKGNVRELRNILERAVTLTETNVIDAEHLGLSDKSLLDSDEQFSADEYDQNQGVNAATLPPSPQHPNTNHNETSVINNGHAHFDNSRVVEDNGFTTSAHTNAQPNTQPDTQIATNLQSDFPQSPSQSIANHQPHTHLKNQKPPLQRFDMGSGFQAPFQNDTPTNILDEKELPEEGLEAYLQEQERQMIIIALNKTRWNKTKAAELLKTTFRSLRYRMKKLKIEAD